MWFSNSQSIPWIFFMKRTAYKPNLFLSTYLWKLVTNIFASVFKLSVHCTYSIGYRKCSPFFFFFMAFSWPFFLSFYTQDIACRHRLGELSLKKKKSQCTSHFLSSWVPFFYSFSYILVSFCFLIHLLEIDCQCWLALQHHGPVPRALRLVKGKAIEIGINLSLVNIQKIFSCVLKKGPWLNSNYHCPSPAVVQICGNRKSSVNQ